MCVCACRWCNPINWNSLLWWVKCLYRFSAITLTIDTRKRSRKNRKKKLKRQWAYILSAWIAARSHMHDSLLRASFTAFLFFRCVCHAKYLLYFHILLLSSCNVIFCRLRRLSRLVVFSVGSNFGDNTSAQRCVVNEWGCEENSPTVIIICVITIHISTEGSQFGTWLYEMWMRYAVISLFTPDSLS